MSELKRRYSRKVMRPLLVFGALAALAVVLTPAGSAGTTSKPFAATFGSVVAAGGGVPIAITDEAKNQLLGSANITAPDGVQIVGTDAPAANVDPSQTYPSQTLMLRNLNLDPPASSTFNATIYVTASSCGSFSWAVEAHQSNDYNSNPGNTLFLDTTKSSLTTVATGGCHLAWIHQPASANASAKITDTAFTPTGNSVAVAVENSSNQPINLNTGTAALSMAGGSFDCGTGCGSFGGLTSSTFQAGVASFPNLKSDFTGTGFTMQASALGLTSPASSPPFVIEPNGLNCVGKDPCVLNTSFGNSGSVNISAHGGHFLFLAVSDTQIPPGQLIAGGGCAFFTGVGVQFAETDGRNGDGTLDLVLSIPNNKLKATYGPNYGNPNVPICAGAKRLDSNGNPVSCSSDPLGGFADRTIDPTTHLFNGGYSTAQCGSDGYWWGVLGTYQDPNPPFDSSLIPLITSWGGTLSSGSRTFVAHEPAGWDGHFGY